MDSRQSSKFVPVKFLREATWRNERISRAEEAITKELLNYSSL